MARGSHDIGKKGEQLTWGFLERKGYKKPTKVEKVKIHEYYFSKGINIEGGYDVIKINDIPKIGKSDICLYEVKTTGEKRGLYINENFKKFGFTLTEKEKRNADTLKNMYRFIFCNLATKTYKIYSLNDFFIKQKSSIYRTWSIFITKDL